MSGAICPASHHCVQAGTWPRCRLPQRCPNPETRRSSPGGPGMDRAARRNRRPAASTRSKQRSGVGRCGLNLYDGPGCVPDTSRPCSLSRPTMPATPSRRRRDGVRQVVELIHDRAGHVVIHHRAIRHRRLPSHLTGRGGNGEVEERAARLVPGRQIPYPRLDPVIGVQPQPDPAVDRSPAGGGHAWSPRRPPTETTSWPGCGSISELPEGSVVVAEDKTHINLLPWSGRPGSPRAPASRS
jgi:hypothetical protein